MNQHVFLYLHQAENVSVQLQQQYKIALGD